MFGVLSRDWYLFVLRGVWCITCGVAWLVWADGSLRVLMIIFGTYAFVDGFIALAAASVRRGETRPRWLVIGGLIGIVAGQVALFWPHLTPTALFYVIATWAGLQGACDIAAGIELRRSVTGERMMVVAGVTSLFWGAAIALLPVTGEMRLFVYLGAVAGILGALWIALGLRLRRDRNQRLAIARA